MKKTALFVAMLLIAVSSCGERPDGSSKYKSLRSLQINDIEELKEKIAEYEGSGRSKAGYVSELSQLHYKLGKKFMERRNWDQAIASLEKSLGYGKDTAATYYSLGLAYANRGKELGRSEDILKAERNYRRALELNRDFSDASYALGILLFYEREEREEGISVMERLIAANRSYYPAHFALGRFYYEVDKKEKALSVYEAIYPELEKRASSSKQYQEYRDSCRENIERLMRELSGS